MFWALFGVFNSGLLSVLCQVTETRSPYLLRSLLARAARRTNVRGRLPGLVRAHPPVRGRHVRAVRCGERAQARTRWTRGQRSDFKFVGTIAAILACC